MAKVPRIMAKVHRISVKRILLATMCHHDQRIFACLLSEASTLTFATLITRAVWEGTLSR